tara:strand:+ start:12297 stop:12662 length:366 start_codon:yes stop_codon:yes gene_type:complete
MRIKSAIPFEEVLQHCNEVEGKQVLIASDWTISAIGTRMVRQVLCKWESEYVTWEQHLEFPSEWTSYQYETNMFSGGYYDTYKKALDCFKIRTAKKGIKFHKCTKLTWESDCCELETTFEN